MKKNFCMAFFATIGLSLVSCTDNESDVLLDEQLPEVELTHEEYASIAYDNPKEISQTALFEIIDNFVSQDPENQNVTRNGGFKNYTVYSRRCVNRANLANDQTRAASNDSILDTNIPCYEVMVENGGHTSFVLASADERAPGVLAYFPQFPTSDIEIQKALNDPNTKAVLAMCQGQVVNEVFAVEQLRKQYRENTIKKVCSELQIPENEYRYDLVKDRIGIKGQPKSATRSEPYYEIPTQEYQYRRATQSPLRWDQYAPYNRALPNDMVKMEFSYGADYTHVPAGCATIAIANLEAIQRRSVVNGVSVDWTALRADSVLTESDNSSICSPISTLNMAGNLVKGIYNALNTTSIRDEEGNVTSSSTTTLSMLNYLKTNFKCSESQTFNPDTVLLSIGKYKPVFVYGFMAGDEGTGTGIHEERHAFVIDGYSIARKNYAQQSVNETRAAIVGKYDMYWHVNLGWGTCSAAYYKLDTDTKCIIDYNDGFGRYNRIYLQFQNIVANIQNKY